MNITSNRLINEKSPYLLQHAHNPVDWYPWSEEAFQKAKSDDKPIFLYMKNISDTIETYNNKVLWSKHITN